MEQEERSSGKKRPPAAGVASGAGHIVLAGAQEGFVEFARVMHASSGLVGMCTK